MKDYLLTETQKPTHTSELQGDKNKTPSEMHVFSNTLMQHQWTKKEFGSKQQTMVKTFLWLKFKFTKYHK